MAERVVLIPFPTENSKEHLVSTKGGIDVEAFTEKLQTAEAVRDEAYARFAKLLEGAQKRKLKAVSVRSHDLREAVVLPPRPEYDFDKPEGKLRLEGYKAQVRRANDIVNFIGAQFLGVRGWPKVNQNDVLCSDSPNLSGVLRRLADEDDVIYIRGHCDAGLDRLTSSDHTKNIDMPGLIAMLDGPLRRDFKGKIKIFACSSANDRYNNDSFAYRFAERLHAAGWTQARIFGYTETLGTYISEGEDEAGFLIPVGHKVATHSKIRAKLRRQEVKL